MAARGGEGWSCGGKGQVLPNIQPIHSKTHLQLMYLHFCAFCFPDTILPSLKAFCNFPQAEYITHRVFLTQRTSRRRPAIDFPLTPSASARVTKSAFTGRDIAVKNRRGINIFPGVLDSLFVLVSVFKEQKNLLSVCSIDGGAHF